VITGEQGNGVERHAATRTVCYQVLGDPAVKPSTSGKVWFITGTSRGFGRIWAEAALERGDRVAATARDITAIQPLADKYGDAVLPMTLDITDAQADRVAVARAFDHFGRVDVIVNNAGYGLFGAVEEVTDEQARRQIDTGLFGALWITQAALPRLRAQGSGHIVQVSSLSGLVTIPYLGMYQAAKFGLEGTASPWPPRLPRMASKSPSSSPAPMTPTGSTGPKRSLPPIRPMTTSRRGGMSTSAARRRRTLKASDRPCSTWSTPISRRCDCSWAAMACPWSRLCTRSVLRRGRRGKRSLTQPTGRPPEKLSGNWSNSVSYHGPPSPVALWRHGEDPRGVDGRAGDERRESGHQTRARRAA
jgi:hypothetical protein